MVAISKDGSGYEEGWAFALSVVRPVLLLGDGDLLATVRRSLADHGIPEAVAWHDKPAVFNWLLGLIQLQGISDANAFAFTQKHGPVRWVNLERSLAERPSCDLLSSYWHFDDCGYRKGVRKCSGPDHLEACPLPALPLRNGRLSQAAYSLYLFIRDVCDGDLVGWIDTRLKSASEPGSDSRHDNMRKALLGPLRQVQGVSDTVLADLLLAEDPERGSWISTGASMIAVDSLVHNFLHHTGILRRLDFSHAYGAGCYGEKGCAEIIRGIAARVDCGDFNGSFPSFFRGLSNTRSGGSARWSAGTSATTLKS